MSRNYFFSYHHASDLKYLSELRNKFPSKKFSDYGFKDEDLSESSKMKISKHIQNRLWASSVVVVLVGEKTGGSAWVDWEIWYSLRRLKGFGSPKRQFKPKGLVALFLPVRNHHIPKRLKDNLDSGYAEKILWDEIDSQFTEKLEYAYTKRSKTGLIRNELPLIDNPRTLSKRVRFFLANLFQI